jgi:hypothetical protein
MAYQFTAANSRYLSAGATVTALPFTMSCWVNAAANAFGVCMAFGNGAGLRVLLGIDINKSFIQTDSLFSYSTNTYAANTWTHVAATARSGSGGGQPWLGGVGGATIAPTFSNLTPTETFIGARRNTTIGVYLTGLIADAAVWNAELTADEIKSLSTGMTADKVRPQSLVFYAPLVRDLIDAKGGLTITNNNTATVANHPRVYA